MDFAVSAMKFDYWFSTLFNDFCCDLLFFVVILYFAGIARGFLNIEQLRLSTESHRQYLKRAIVVAD